MGGTRAVLTLRSAAGDVAYFNTQELAKLFAQGAAEAWSRPHGPSTTAVPGCELAQRLAVVEAGMVTQRELAGDGGISPLSTAIAGLRQFNKGLNEAKHLGERRLGRHASEPEKEPTAQVGLPPAAMETEAQGTINVGLQVKAWTLLAWGFRVVPGPAAWPEDSAKADSMGVKTDEANALNNNVGPMGAKTFQKDTAIGAKTSGKKRTKGRQEGDRQQAGTVDGGGPKAHGKGRSPSQGGGR